MADGRGWDNGRRMWCAIYLGILVVVGYPLAAGLARGSTGKASPPERLEIAALSACMGPGIVGILLIFLSMLGERPGRAEILAIGAAWGAAGIAVWRLRPAARKALPPRVKLVEPGTGAPKWWTIACFIAIGYGLLVVGIDALNFPVIEWDAFAIWQLKAEVLAVLPMHPRPGYFSDVTLSYSHLRYPVLEPMVCAGMHAMTGRLDDLGKTISLLWYPGMLGAVYCAVRRINGTTAAVTATALLACLEPFCRYGGTGTAETALTAFYACGILCILRWQETGDWGYAILAAIFSAWMAWTKNEGLALAAVNVVVMAAMGPRGKWGKSLAAAGMLAAVVAILYIPWIAYTWGLPRTDEDYGARLNPHEICSNLGRLGMILKGMGTELINWQDWGLMWVIALGLAAAERRRFKDRAVATIGILLILHLLAYVPPLMVTNWKLEELLSVSTDRLMMHVAPVGAILIGALWPTWVGGTGSKLSVEC
ncbi:MAG: glycosyltransferase family 39 protein [Tepidisphaeraceae bacterium]